MKSLGGTSLPPAHLRPSVEATPAALQFHFQSRELVLPSETHLLPKK